MDSIVEIEKRMDFYSKNLVDIIEKYIERTNKKVRKN